MGKISKKSLSVLLAITIIFSSAYVGLNELDFAGLFAVEAEAANVESLVFELSEDGTSYSVIDCDENVEGEIVIPETYNGLPVTSIGDAAFECCFSLTSIEIPGSVVEIDSLAFLFCNSLESIDVDKNNPNYSSQDGILLNKSKNELICVPFGYPESVFTIPETVIKLKSGSILYCKNIRVLIIPDTVKYIEHYAVYLPYLSFSYIGKNIDYVGDSGLHINGDIIINKELNGIQSEWVSVHVGADDFWSAKIFYTGSEFGFNELLDSGKLYGLLCEPELNCLDVKYGIYEDFYYLETEDEIRISAYLGTEKKIVFPSRINNKPVTSFNDTVFPVWYHAGLGIESYYDGLIYSDVETITLPETISTLNIEALSYCDKLEEVNINSENNCFSSKDGIVFNKDKTELILYPAGRTDEIYEIPNSVISIGDKAFYNCRNLKSIEIPDSVKSIGQDAFIWTAYYENEDNWENGVLYISNHLIDAKNITGSYTIKPGTKTIACYAFFSCYSLTSIEIPDSITNIGASAFNGCTSLTSIEIPDSVTSIGEYALYDCPNLKYIFYSGPEEEGQALFDNIDYIGLSNNISIHYNSTGHTFDYGFCIVCGEECTHDFSGNVCSVCGYEIFESAHPYENNYINTWIINRPNAESISVTFSNDTETESGYDYIYIYDENDNQVGRYDGTTLAGQTITVEGEVVKIKLTTDSSQTYYGFRVTNITYVKVCDHSFTNSVCDNCGYECEQHSFSEGICNRCGYECDHDYFVGYCTICNLECEHNWVIDEENSYDPTCDYSGFTAKICSICHMDTSEYEAPTGHSYVNEVCEKCGDVLFGYWLDDGGITITGYRGESTDVVIPETIDNHPVVAIAGNAFVGTSSRYLRITSIEIPATVKDISANAFPNYLDSEWGAYSYSLETIKVDNNNTNYSSEDGVLYNKDKTTLLYMPLEKDVFSFKVPDTVKTIEYNGFNSNINWYIIPESVETINYDGWDSFSLYCVYEGTQSQWHNRFGYDDETFGTIYYEGIGIGECPWAVLQDIPQLPSSVSLFPRIRYIVKKDGTAEIVAFVNYSLIGNLTGDAGKLPMEIPSTIDGYTVASIGEGAFEYCNIISNLTVPETVKSIGKEAFNYTELETITLPDTLVSIGADAFGETPYYSNSANWENSVLYIGNHLIDVKESVTGTFKVSKDTIVIADEAFRGTNVSSVNVPESSALYKSQDGILYNKDMTELIFYTHDGEPGTYEMPQTVTSVKDNAFYGNSIRRLVLSSSMTELNYDAFNFISVREVAIPLSITKIDDDVFSEMLKYVFYEGGVEDKSKIAMDEAETGLGEAIWHYNATDHTDSDWIIDKTATTHEMGTKHKECIVCGYVTITERIPLLSGLNFVATSMSSYKLASYDGIKTDLTIPATHNNCAVTAIGNGCFKDNSEIERIVVPVGATEIGYLAFANCKSLKVVSIPATVTSIGMQAFYGFTGTIYCQKDSVAHKYAVENGIDFIIPTIEAKNDKTRVDFDEQIVFTSVTGCRSIDELLDTPTTVISLPVASQVTNTGEIYGTGSTITVFDGNKFMGDYTLIVEGDLNGDGTCDVGDAAIAYLYSVDMEEATENQVLAANGCVSDELDAESYQNVVNKCLAS